MSNVEVITEVISIGNLLKNTLEEEFLALSEKNLEHLETVQVRKVELLQNLESTWPKGETESLALNEPLWDEARNLIGECKEAHIRNDLLLKRQLEVVRTVLASLTKRSTDNSSNLYDKMGKMKRKRQPLY
jgi:flagellar biosynthesis/type III secretory pathway chaperone